MGRIADAFAQTFADGPSSEPQEVDKTSARRLGPLIEGEFSGAAAGAKRGPTIASLGTGDRNNQPAQVTDGADKGEYYWNGSAWIRTGDLFDPAAVQADITAVQDGLDDVSARVPEIESNSYMVPVVTNQSGDVPVWLQNGDFNARGMAPGLRQKAVADIVSQTNAGDRIALWRAGKKVLLWLDKGRIKGPGLESGAAFDPETIAPIYEPRQSPANSLPIRTDDRSLSAYRTKKAKLDMEYDNVVLSIVLGYDSWTDITAIPATITNLFEGAGYEIAGPGFRGVEADVQVFAGPLTLSGWTFVDGSSSTTYPYGVGVDGKCIWTNGTAATLSWVTSRPATTINIHTMGFGGVWRWRVDSGAWTTVTSPNDSAFHIVAISGLADTVHTLQIDTTGNTAVVSIVGFDGRRDGVSGVIVHKIGNGGLSLRRMERWFGYIGAPAAHLSADLAIMIGGTNDSRYGDSTPEAYVTRLQTLEDIWRGAAPQVGFLFVSPPQHGDAEIQPLAVIEPAKYAWCVQRGHAWLNALDSWPDHATATAQGLWEQPLHISISDASPTDAYRAGVKQLVDQINTHFLHV